MNRFDLVNYELLLQNFKGSNQDSIFQPVLKNVVNLLKSNLAPRVHQVCVELWRMYILMWWRQQHLVIQIQNITDSRYHIEDQTVSFSHETLNLGVKLDPQFRWTSQIEITHIYSIIYVCLHSLTLSFNCNLLVTRKKIFDTLIFSHLSYFGAVIGCFNLWSW